MHNVKHKIEGIRYRNDRVKNRELPVDACKKSIQIVILTSSGVVKLDVLKGEKKSVNAEVKAALLII